MLWNLGFPKTAPVIFIGPLPLKKRSTEEKTPWERLPKGDRFESLRMLRSQAAQAPAVRWSSCEISVMAKM